MLEIGIKETQSVKVEKENLVNVTGSGYLSVFATPSMITLMEMTAAKSVSEHMDEGKDTVGTLINVKHPATNLCKRL